MKLTTTETIGFILAVLCALLNGGCSGPAFTTAVDQLDADTLATTGGSAPTGGSSAVATGGSETIATTGGSAATGGSSTQLTTIQCEPATLVNWQCGSLSGPAAGAPGGLDNDTSSVWECLKTNDTINPPNPTFGGHQAQCNDNGFAAVCFHC